MKKVLIIVSLIVLVFSARSYAQTTYEEEVTVEDEQSEQAGTEEHTGDGMFEGRRGLFSIGVSVGMQNAMGFQGSEIDDTGMTVAGSVRYFSKYILGLGLSYFASDHDAAGSSFNDASVRGGTIDIYAADLGQIGAMYLLASIGTAKETFYFSSPTPTSFQTVRSRTNGFGAGFFIFVGQNFALGSEFRYYNLRESQNTDALKQFLITINSTF